MKIRARECPRARRQRKLYEQRKFLQLHLHRVELEKEVDRQREVRQHGETRVTSWWRHEDESGEIEQGCTSSSTNYGQEKRWSDGELETTGTKQSGGGFQPVTTTSCYETTESWKTLVWRKACNMRKLLRRTDMVTRVTRSESALDGGDCEDYLEESIEVPRGGTWTRAGD
eukprot:jgi/Phyca11/123375/e_gw1.50.334.1